MQCEEEMHSGVHSSGKVQLQICAKIVDFIGDLLAKGNRVI